MRAVALFFGLFLTLTHTGLFAATELCPQQKCVAVVDAGSSGSRVHIYSYDLDADNSPIKITERWSKKITPGFAKIKVNPASVSAYLGILFADAPIQNMPIHFFATAGMRLMPKSTQLQLYTLVKNWFKNKPEWQEVDTKTISGTEEGLFGWLSVNYQLGTLTDESKVVGVVDMGGASVQIAFPANNSSKIAEDDNLQQVDIYGHHFKVFVHSFLGLGQNEIFPKFINTPACFSNDYPLPNGKFASGDAYTCKEGVSSLVNGTFKVNDIVQPVLADNPVDNWFVLGGLATMAKNKPFEYTRQEFTNQDLTDKANNLVCQQQWSILSTQYPDEEYLYGFCLFPAYYNSLMVDGYGIDSHHPIKYLRDNQNSDWTIGVVLHPQEENRTQTSQ